jgi:hypothetical protein
MKNIAYWTDRLDNEGVSQELKYEFIKTLNDLALAMSISEEKTNVNAMFTIIDLFGDEDTDSERLKRYLYYCLGDIVCSESYAYALAISDVDTDKAENIIFNAMNYA